MQTSLFRRTRITRSALILFATHAAFAHAQNPEGFSISLPPVGVNAFVQRALSGEFNGSPMIDALFLREHRLVLVYDPALGEANGVLEGDFLDVASYPPISPGAKQSIIVTQAQDEPQSLTWDIQASAFTRAPLLSPAGQAAAGSTLHGCVRVEVGQVTGSDAHDVVLVRADRRHLSLLKGHGGAEFEYITAENFAPFTSDDIRDACLVDADGDGLGEIFAITRDRVECFDSDGAALMTTSLDSALPQGSQLHAVEAITRHEPYGGSVVVLARTPGGRFQLVLMNGASFAVEQTLDITSLLPTSMGTVDYDGDGATDLVLNSAVGAPITCLLQQAGQYALTPELTPRLLAPDAPRATLGSQVLMTDLDNDGDVDVLYPVEGQSEAFMAKGTAVDHRALTPELLVDEQAEYEHIWLPDPGTLTFRYRFRPHDDLDPSSQRQTPAAATHLQMVLWEAQQEAQGGYRTDPLPSSDIAMPLDALNFVQQSTWCPFPFVQWQFPVYESAHRSTTIYYLTGRYVRLGPDGSIEEAWPHTTYYFADDSNQAGQAYVSQLPFASPGVTLWREDPAELSQSANASPPQVSGGTRVGGGGGTGCIPDYPPNCPPPQCPPPVVPD